MEFIFSYYLYLLTFLAYPILVFILSKYIDFGKKKKYFLFFFLLFLCYDILYFLHYSIKGDYADYIVFSLQYFYFCLILMVVKSTNIFVQILKIIGTIIMSIGFLQGLIGIFMFIVISQGYESDKIYKFNYDNATYETRRYSFGFATLDDTRYTFDTYRKYHYLPFEKRINTTDFMGFESNLNFHDEKLSICIKNDGNKRQLEFSSTNGEIHTTTIDRW